MDALVGKIDTSFLHAGREFNLCDAEGFGEVPEGMNAVSEHKLSELCFLRSLFKCGLGQVIHAISVLGLEVTFSLPNARTWHLQLPYGERMRKPRSRSTELTPPPVSWRHPAVLFSGALLFLTLLSLVTGLKPLKLALAVVAVVLVLRGIVAFVTLMFVKPGEQLAQALNRSHLYLMAGVAAICSYLLMISA